MVRTIIFLLLSAFLAIAASAELGVAVGQICNHVEKQRVAVRWSAYVAEHHCVEGRAGLCYKAAPMAHSQVVWKCPHGRPMLVKGKLACPYPLLQDWHPIYED